ncbi:MAG: stage III sporulation protein AE [Clostridia bacterium]|nr:stage III sporulation protein AE [Clostridia bacterium]
MKVRKLFTIIIILLIVNVGVARADEYEEIIKSQEDSLGITDFLQESNKYTAENFSDIDLQEILQSAISGNIDGKKISSSIFKIFGNEIQSAITIFGSIIIIVIINSLLNCITDGLQNKSVSQIAYYVQYILIVTIILTNFSSIIDSIKQSVNDMTSFTNILVPLMMTLIISTGSITTASVMQPLIIFMITLIGNFINNVAIPLILMSTALGIMSQMSDRVQIGRLAKRIKSSTVWIIGIVLTIFVTMVSVNGNLSVSVDAVAAKTAKTAVSNLVPLVGKILGDAMESVLGCSNILKNAIGVIGVIVVIAISVSPIIKLLLFMCIYYLGSAICEPIADVKIVKLFDQMGDTFKVLLALVCSMSVMIIIGTALVIRISNIGSVS